MWNDKEGNHKIHLANWSSICMKTDFGGLGIANLQDLNLCLLGSWIKRYIQGKGLSGSTLLMPSIILKFLIYCVAMTSNPLSFEKV